MTTRQARGTHVPLPTSTPGHPRNCNCLPCCDVAASWVRQRRRRIAYGTWQPFVDAAPSRAHIEDVHDSGIAYRQIARLAGVTLWDLNQIRAGRLRVRPTTEAAILAVSPNPQRLEPKAFLPALGKQRRIQGMRAIGWPNPELSRRSKRSLDSLSRILSSPFVWASTHLAIVDVYDDLHDQDPAAHGVKPWIVRRGINYAQAQGWAVPTAWTDIDSDEAPNPRIRTPRYASTASQYGQQELIDETLTLALDGATRAEIAERLGITWDAIGQAHRRAEKPLPIRLQIEALEAAG